MRVAASRFFSHAFFSFWHEEAVYASLDVSTVLGCEGVCCDSGMHLIMPVGMWLAEAVVNENPGSNLLV